MASSGGAPAAHDASGAQPQRYVFDDASSLIQGRDNRLWFEESTGAAEDGYDAVAPVQPTAAADPAHQRQFANAGHTADASRPAHHGRVSPPAPATPGVDGSAHVRTGSGAYAYVSDGAAANAPPLPPPLPVEYFTPGVAGGSKSVPASPGVRNVAVTADGVPSEHAREGDLVTPGGPVDGSPPPNTASVLGFPDVAPTPPTTVFVDIAALTCVLHYEVVYRRYLRRWVQAVLYFTLIIVIAMLHTDIQGSYYMTSFIKDRLTTPYINGVPDATIATASTPDEVWDWLETVWTPAVFADYDVPELTPWSQVVMDTYNKVAMSPVLRTRRRAAGDCDGVFLETAQPGFLYCAQGTSTEPYIRNGRMYQPVDGLRGKAASRRGKDFYAVLRVNENSYSDGDLATFNVTNASTALAAIQTLRADEWFSSENEFLELTLVLYNPYIDVVANFRMVFDVSSGGGVAPLASGSLLHITRLDWYTIDRDKARFVLELIFMIATFLEAIFTYSHIRRAKRRGASVLAYFTSSTWAWNWFEVVYVLVALAALSLYIRLIVQQPTLPDLTPVLDGRYEAFSDVFGASKTINCVLIALTGIKIIRYMGFVPGFAHLFRTLEKVISPLTTFLIVIFVLCIGFACAGMYAFGTADSSFTTFGPALQRVLSFYTREVSYFDLIRPETDVTRGVFPPMFYWALFLLMSFVVTGTVVGIAVVSHFRARDELRDWYDVKASAERWRRLAPRREWYWRLPGTAVFDMFPKYMLEVLGASGKRWIIPLMVEYPATSKLIAEVGGGRLRVYLSVQSWFQRKLIGARGVAVALPPDAIAPVSSRLQRGCIAKVSPGQAPYLTTEPLSGTSEIEFLVDGNVLRTKGGVDLGMAQGQTVVLEFPRVINDQYAWPSSEVLVCADTVSRIATYGGCFTHSPADWIVCSVGLPTTLETCPFLVTVPEVPLEDILQAVDHSGVDLDDDEWRHSVTSLAQMFSRTVELPVVPRAHRNPLDNEHRSLPRLRPTPQMRPA